MGLGRALVMPHVPRLGGDTLGTPNGLHWGLLGCRAGVGV